MNFPADKRCRDLGGADPERGKTPAGYLFRRLYLLLFPLFFFGACLDKIDIAAPKDLLPAVAIQGVLVKGAPSTIRVEVSSLFNFSGTSRRLIDVAEVLLIDEAGQSLRLPAVGIGVYYLEIPEDHPGFRVETGSAYRLRVSTRDGRTYESVPEPVLPVPPAGNLRAELVDKEVLNKDGEMIPARYVRFFLDTRLVIDEGGQKARLKWDALKTYRATDLEILAEDGIKPVQTCYITEVADVTRLWLLDGSLIAAEEATGIMVHEEAVGPRFAEGFYLTVLQQSLSEEGYRYWSQVDELIERTGSIFEPPAGKLKSNFANVNDPEEEAFGLFYAVAQDTVRIYVSPEFAENPGFFCPPSGPLFNQSGDCNYQVCCDCLQVSNSTLLKPDFWVE